MQYSSPTSVPKDCAAGGANYSDTPYGLHLQNHDCSSYSSSSSSSTVSACLCPRSSGETTTHASVDEKARILAAVPFLSEGNAEDLVQLQTRTSRKHRQRRPRIRKRDPSSIPRPLNCFLTYRLAKQKIITKLCPGANHRDISKVIAKWWHEEPKSVKDEYRELARLEKVAHSRKYPNYKYSPKKKNTTKAEASKEASKTGTSTPSYKTAVLPTMAIKIEEGSKETGSLNSQAAALCSPLYGHAMSTSLMPDALTPSSMACSDYTALASTSYGHLAWPYQCGSNYWYTEGSTVPSDGSLATYASNYYNHNIHPLQDPQTTPVLDSNRSPSSVSLAHGDSPPTIHPLLAQYNANDLQDAGGKLYYAVDYAEVPRSSIHFQTTPAAGPINHEDPLYCAWSEIVHTKVL